MEPLQLRDVLELAREYRVRRIKVGDIEVEMAPEGMSYDRPEAPAIPSQAQVAAVQPAREIADAYKAAFGGKLPSFPTR